MLAIASVLVAATLGIWLPGRPPGRALPSPQANFLVPPEKAPLRVIVYVIDALKPDHLDAYGYKRTTAPTLSQVAREGVRFTRCFSNSTWSLASIRSLFVGMHGAAYRRDSPPPKVPESLDMLPEFLQRAGLRTGIVSENIFVSSRYGMTQGFDFLGDAYAHLESSSATDTGHRKLNMPTLDHLDAFLKESGKDSFFLYVHTMEPHAPLVIPDSAPPLYSAGSTPKEDLTGWYDSAVRWADTNLALFIELLNKYDLYDDTLLIVTADHGESLYPGESGGIHRGPPLPDRTHIPLIIRCPGMARAGSVITENVQLLDIAPTIFNALRMTIPAQYQGRSLVRLLVDGNDDSLRSRPIVAAGEGMKGQAIVLGDWYYFRAQGNEHLYGIAGSVVDGTDRLDDNRALATTMRELADSHIREHQQAYENHLATAAGGIQRVIEGIRGVVADKEQGESSPESDHKHIEALKALGYL